MSDIKPEFWKPEPKRPWEDWRMYTMLFPIILSAIGLFLVGIFAYAMKDIRVIDPNTQSWLIVIGGALIVFGAELNTPFTTVECFRKIRLQEHDWMDVSALVASLVGTAINVLLALSLRIETSESWQTWVLNFGPLVSVVAVSLDYYGATVELAGLFSDFDKRYPAWLEEKQTYENTLVPGNEQENRINDLERKLEILSYPVANFQWFKSYVASQNGNLAKYKAMQPLEAVEQICVSGGRRFDKSERTSQNWIKEIQ